MVLRYKCKREGEGEKRGRGEMESGKKKGERDQSKYWDRKEEMGEIEKIGGVEKGNMRYSNSKEEDKIC